MTGGHRTHAPAEAGSTREALCGASSPHGLSIGTDFPAPWVNCKNCLGIIAFQNAAWRAGVPSTGAEPRP